MVHWLMLILTYDFAILQLSWSEVTLSLRLLHYKNRNGLTYENRPCDARLEHDINRDGRCDTGFLFCLVRLPFQNPHNCTLGDHFTGFVGADDIHFINIDEQQKARSRKLPQQRSSMVSLWFQPTIYFRFKYPKMGIGLIVEVFDIDDIHNQTIHDSIDFYGRTLLDLKLYPSIETAQPHRIYLKSLFGSYTNLTADFSLYCSPNYFGNDCEILCLSNQQRYDCEPNTGQKLCKQGYFGQDCLNDVRACEHQPCQNNGTCVVYLRSYLCQCQKGFTGRSCEIGSKIVNTGSMCNQANCIHGDCSIQEKCLCHANWTSDNCNQSLIIKPSGCANRPCLHNSTCETLVGVNPESAYRCHCRIGFTGRNCEVAIVTSCERTPCIHGRCIKIDLYTEICLCEKQWTGIDCSQTLTVSTPIPVTIVRLQSSTTTTRKYLPSTTLTSAKPILTTIKTKLLPPIKSSTTNLHDYLIWLNANFGDGQNSSPTKSVTLAPLNVQKLRDTPCLSGPCLHNSTCVVQSNHAFQCLCSSAYIGVYCEIEILNVAHFQQNLCEKSPCLHQSVCVTKSNHEVQCICRPHYTGKFCEHPPPFQPLPSNPKCNRICRNGGICLIDEANQEQCICRSSYTGIFCELLKNNCSYANNNNKSLCHVDPCLSHPCQSNGTCHSLLSNFSCSCIPEFTGNRCEIEIDSDTSLVHLRDGTINSDQTISTHHNTDLWPLAIVFGYVFSLMLVFIIIWFLWYGLTIRPQSYFRSDIPFGERVTDRYQPYRLGVSNPLFFTHQEFNGNTHTKSISTPPTTISNLEEWSRTLR